MVYETLCNLQGEIETLLKSNEIQYKSVRVAHYREASYFAFDGSYVYFIIDYQFSCQPTFCFVGATTNLGPTLRLHARNHKFSHAFVIDLYGQDEETRKLTKELLIKQFTPAFQGKYSPFERYRYCNYERECLTREAQEIVHKLV